MESVLVAIAVYLAAYVGMKVAVDWKGMEAFKNPGGWKFPVGEVLPLAFALFTFLGIGQLWVLVN
jgi:TRAP-type mannitol/chloroaromatic compound transport system permease small subunit